MRIAAIGDLHVKEDHTRRGLPRAVRGDLQGGRCAGAVRRPDRYRQAEAGGDPGRGPRACSIPVIAVLGNHDYECGHVEEVREILSAAGVKLLEGESCEVDGVGFVGVKGFAGGFGRRMLSSFGEPAIKSFVTEAVQEAMQLENACGTVQSEARARRPALRADRRDGRGRALEIFPFLGSSRLAETIDRFPVTRDRARPRPSRRLRGSHAGRRSRLQRRLRDREADRQAVGDAGDLSAARSPGREQASSRQWNFRPGKPLLSRHGKRAKSPTLETVMDRIEKRRAGQAGPGMPTKARSAPGTSRC